MRTNRSPWIHQLDASRAPWRLEHDLETDVAIVGAGIAGVATAFFTLADTKKRVALLERYKLAHGATGHNAGQVVSYFERGFASLADEFGLELAAAGEGAIEGAWELLERMYAEAKLDIPFARFTGHAGLLSYQQVLWHLSGNKLRRQAGGLGKRRIILADDAPFLADIPAEFRPLYTVVPRGEVLDTLETKRADFVGALSFKKGCVNSALLCQEVIRHLLAAYPDRFALYEHTPVHKAVLREQHAILDADRGTVVAQRVVLCTNGFESIRIINDSGLDIDAKYHHLVSGKIGYMSGYLETLNKPPAAISYYTDPRAGFDNSYYYLTRRPFEYERGFQHNLISVGGPDQDLSEGGAYSHADGYPDDAVQKIDGFVRSVYDTDPNKTIDYVFTWHGLMGYTRNGVRLIGAEPKNETLLYNLGCNGIGILPSVYGGWRISRLLRGDTLEKSIFDVPAR